MQPHQDRVVEEKDELASKWSKLSLFISEGSPAYRELPLMEKERLHVQAYLMGRYLTVLQDRIDYFNEI